MKMKKLFFRALIGIVLCYTGILGYMYFNQRSFQYLPELDTTAFEQHRLLDTEEVFLTTTDGVKIQTWYHPPKQDKPVALFFHGNSGTLAARIDKLQVLSNMGYGFIIPAWRGFGKSTGSPTEEGLYNDARAAIAFAKSRGHDTSEIVLIGESLGTGVATNMATEYQFKGVLLITPYTSLCDVGMDTYPYLPVRPLLKDKFYSIDNIDKIKAPLCIIHGDNDDIISHHHSLKLFDKAKGKKKLIIYPGVGHSNYDINVVLAEMERFFSGERESVEESVKYAADKN